MQDIIVGRQAWESQSEKLTVDVQKHQPKSKMLQAFNNFVPWYKYSPSASTTVHSSKAIFITKKGTSNQSLA